MSNLDQSGWPKLVAPPVIRTPDPLAGPGVSSPTARTRFLGTEVIASTLSKESTSAVIALSGPSLTRLGSSAIVSTRNRPRSSRTVPLFAVPPLSMPTVTQPSGASMNPPKPLKLSSVQKTVSQLAAAGKQQATGSRGAGPEKEQKRSRALVTGQGW